jgi:hypothetical protein
MSYKSLIYFFFIIVVSGCSSSSVQNNDIISLQRNLFSNKGFSLVYDETLFQNKIVSKKLDERGLLIFQKNLKKNSLVKIRNILNNKTILVKVGKNASYPSFNNSVISKRIANELDLDLTEPYTEIISISENSVFFAKRTKTFDEEKNVANKVPVNNISINDLNNKKEKKLKKTRKNFSYTIKIADFYFNETAFLMVKRIKNETKIKNPKIEKISNEEYRVYLGPFDNISSLQNSFNDINILGFENLEIIKND